MSFLLIIIFYLASSCKRSNAGKAEEVCRWAVGASDVCGWMSSARTVETRCTFRFRGGLTEDDDDDDESDGGPALEVRLNDTTIVVQPHNANNSRRLVPPQLLCSHEGSQHHELALVKTVNSFEYLFRYWPYFVSSAVWARRSHLRLALWVGELPTQISGTVSEECVKSPEFPKGELGHLKHDTSLYLGSANVLVSNHHIKILAVFALLNEAGVRGVVYADLDALATVPKATIYRRVHAENEVDVLFGVRTHESFWRVKSSSFYMRNGPLARRFLATWMTTRCGFKDQYSLWHAVLRLADAYGCMEYQDEIYRTEYRDAQALVTKENPLFRPGLQVTCADRITRCPNFRFCTENRDYKDFFAVLEHESVSRDDALRLTVDYTVVVQNSSSTYYYLESVMAPPDDTARSTSSPGGYIAALVDDDEYSRRRFRVGFVNGLGKNLSFSAYLARLGLDHTEMRTFM